MRYLIIVFSIGIGLFAQYPGTEWGKYYGYSHNSHSVYQVSDGGFILAGCTGPYATLARNVYILKIDSQGDTIWSRNHGDSGWDSGECIQQTIDGGFIISGRSESRGNFSLMKTDSLGYVDWWKGYKCGGSTAWCVDQTKDGGYIAVGGEGDYLLKTNTNGDSLWSKGYGGDARFCQQTSDGGYIVTGQKDNDVYLVKTDSMGDSLWARKYGGSSSDVGLSVKETSDKGYIITGGYSGAYVYLIKVDSIGDTLWTKKFGGLGGPLITRGRSVCETPDSGFIIAGQKYQFIEDYRMSVIWLWVIKTDSEGKKMWDCIMGELGLETTGYSVQNTLDSGYVVAGTKVGPMRIIVAKIKSDYAGIEEDDEASQRDFSLLGCNLTPFANEIEIQYEIHKETNICLEIYNMLGQKIVVLADERRDKGFYTETWDGKDICGHNVPSGVYFLKLETPDFKKTGKIFLLR